MAILDIIYTSSDLSPVGFVPVPRGSKLMQSGQIRCVGIPDTRKSDGLHQYFIIIPCPQAIFNWLWSQSLSAGSNVERWVDDKTVYKGFATTRNGEKGNHLGDCFARDEAEAKNILSQLFPGEEITIER